MPSRLSNFHKFDVKVPVADLRVGMFISGLDRDWLETPFLIQGFYIQNAEDIEKIAEYCNYVYVLSAGARNFDETVDLKSGALIGRKPVEYPVQTKVATEHKEVKKLTKIARKHVREVLDCVRHDETLDSKKTRAIVSESVDSVIRHPDAQLLMTKLRGQDEYTAEHCLNVCVLAIVFGRRLGLRRHQLNNLGLCGLLHDVGKIKVPDEILNKEGRLTPEEFEVMKLHADYGKEFLEKNRDVLQDAIDVAYSHHERPDGRGYPRGLAEKDLSLYSKIISIVDAYDAITADRPYAAGRPSTEALRIIYENRGTQFESNLALAFIQTIGIYPPGTLVELVNGYVGLVTQVIDSPSHLPDVLLLLDENKDKCEERIIQLKRSVSGELDKGFLIKTPIADGCYGISLWEYFNKGFFEIAPK